MSAVVGHKLSDLGVNLWIRGPVAMDALSLTIARTFLRDLARVHIELCSKHFGELGSLYFDAAGEVRVGPLAVDGAGPFHSSTEYFAHEADRFRMIADNTPSSTPLERQQRLFAARVWKRAVESVIDPRDNFGPFVLQHHDLHEYNIVVDKAGHIIGILDLDSTSTVPIDMSGVPSIQVSTYPARRTLEDVHHLYNSILREEEMAVGGIPGIPSKRSLADLHDSRASCVTYFVGYYLDSMKCDYNIVGRALFEEMYPGQDMEEALLAFLHSDT